MDPSMFDFIEKVVYINLAKRTDRRDHMEHFIQMFGDKVIRFEAIECVQGILGAGKSHIAVLEMAIENNWKNVLILEDDVVWNIKEESINCFKKLTKNDFDALLLGGSRSAYEEDTFKLIKSCGAHAYIVNNHYFQTLLRNFKESIILYEQTNCDYHYHFDEHWKLLMPQDNWFLITPNLVYQHDGYSDIIKQFRTDKSRFIL